MRLCYELHGDSVQANKLADDLFELRSGKWRAVIRVNDSRFQGREIAWRVRNEENVAVVEAMLNSEDEEFNVLSATEMELAVALEILSVSQAPQLKPLKMTKNPESGTLQTQWELDSGKLMLITPLKPLTEIEAHKFGY